jgi:hypothetical protein
MKKKWYAGRRRKASMGKEHKHPLRVLTAQE